MSAAVGATMEAMELSDVRLFEGLSQESLQQMSSMLHRSKVPTGTVLMSAQLPGEVYFILEGSVKIQLVTGGGTEITIALLGPGDTVGETSVVSRRSRATSAVTREETTVLWMARRDFLRCLDVMPLLYKNLVRQLSERLRAANERIQALATLDVTGRVAQQLLELTERYGTLHPGEGVHIRLHITQGELAEMVAATRERVNHVMVTLRKAGAVSVDAEHRLTVHHPEALVKLCRT